ncbi:hypothetical protein GLAREA_12693 [Glarea lozoyensis ATCC 20868]|uniref:Uncharacterized protein n=1 Tax=Glarea lozoyensis (strain ATCC 20868 / MF5171) TaxID=1116229 RepID=S3D0L5_GLAL2|nr:uncharacterized protein GLAREA_12693 [Glarea lozoyensis ATCC 20868]EPE31390.1 hypothetical protein GLAREA_12693 [Glarea lozoyensis ATCC 20868]
MISEEKAPTTPSPTEQPQTPTPSTESTTPHPDPTTPPQLSPNAQLMREFEKDISTKASTLTDWPKLITELRRLSLIHIQKQRIADKSEMEKALLGLGKYAQAHFERLRRAQPPDAKSVIEGLKWVYKEDGREVEVKREHVFGGC